MTHHNSSIEVRRRSNAPYASYDMMRLAIQERIVQLDYPVTLKHSVTEFRFLRNCHDYAWSPYMSCMCNPGPLGGQKECWEMANPSQNWIDGSVTNLVSSVGDVNHEYVFNTSDLAQLDIYTDEFFDWLIPFPVCPVNTANDFLDHSAIALRFVPTASNWTYSYGIYWSKLGNLGIFEHRWGPQNYPAGGWNPAYPLRIFVPNGKGWGGQPPWLVYWPDPFGPN